MAQKHFALDVYKRQVLEELGCHHITHKGGYYSCGNPDGDNKSAITVYELSLIHIYLCPECTDELITYLTEECTIPPLAEGDAV